MSNDTSGSGDDQGKFSFVGIIRSISNWLSAAFPGHKNAVMLGLAGFVLAVLFFAIGFWRTLLITLFVVVGVAIGQVLDGDPKILRAVQRWLNRNN